MRIRNTILALILLSGLGLYIYYYEYRGEESREAARRSEEEVFPFDQDSIRGLEITAEGGGTVSLARENGAWRIVSPIESPADQDRIRSILNGLGSLRIARRLDDVTDADRKEFKLEPPVARVQLRLAPSDGGPEESDVVIGDKTPVGSNRYVSRPGGGQVMIVSGSLDSVLSADPSTLRLKKLIGMESWKMGRVRIERQGATLELAKSDGAWRLVAPIDFPADGTKVQSLLGDLQSAEAGGFESETPDDAELARLGLSDPALTVTVTPDSEGAPVTLTFGAPAGADKAYARRADMKAVAWVATDLLGKLEKAVEEGTDLRDRHPAPIDRFMLSRLEITSGDRRILLFKDDASKWRWGAADGPVVGSEQVNGLIDALVEMEATSFDEQPGTPPGEASLSVSIFQGTDTEQKEIAIHVLPASEDAEVPRRVVSSESASVYLVPVDAVTKLDEAVASLEEPAGEETPADEGEKP